MASPWAMAVWAVPLAWSPEGNQCDGIADEQEQERHPRPPSTREGHAGPMVARRPVLGDRPRLTGAVAPDDEPEQDDQEVRHRAGEAVQVGDERRIGRRVAGHQVLDHAEQHPAHHRDGDRAQPAEDHRSQGAEDHQGEDDGIEAEERGDQDPAEPGQHGGEHPGHRRRLGGADPLQTGQVPAVDHRPHLQADPGMAKDDPQHQGRDEGGAEHRQLVRGEGHVLHDVEHLWGSRPQPGGEQALVTSLVADQPGMEDVVADGHDGPLHEAGNGHQQADGADHPGVDRGLGQAPKEQPVEGEAHERGEDEDREDGGRHDGHPARIELVVEVRHREGDGALGEVEDA